MTKGRLPILTAREIVKILEKMDLRIQESQKAVILDIVILMEERQQFPSIKGKQSVIVVY